jgi:hypothetical protein
MLKIFILIVLKIVLHLILLKLEKYELLIDQKMYLSMSLIVYCGRDTFISARFKFIDITTVLDDYGALEMSQNSVLWEVFFKVHLAVFLLIFFDQYLNLKGIVASSVLYVGKTLNLISFGIINVKYLAFSSIPLDKIIFSGANNFHFESFYNCPNLTAALYNSPISNVFKIPPRICGLK